MHVSVLQLIHHVRQAGLALLEAGADPTTQVPDDLALLSTAVHVAASSPDLLPVLHKIISLGFPISGARGQIKASRTPLMVAIASQCYANAAVLLEAGASPNEGVPMPLDLAISRKDAKMVFMLLCAGACLPPESYLNRAEVVLPQIPHVSSVMCLFVTYLLPPYLCFLSSIIVREQLRLSCVNLLTAFTGARDAVSAGSLRADAERRSMQAAAEAEAVQARAQEEWLEREGLHTESLPCAEGEAFVKNTTLVRSSSRAKGLSVHAAVVSVLYLEGPLYSQNNKWRSYNVFRFGMGFEFTGATNNSCSLLSSRNSIALCCRASSITAFGGIASGWTYSSHCKTDY